MDVDGPQPAATPNQLEVIREPPCSAAFPQVEVAPLESPSVASAQLLSDVPSSPHHPTPPDLPSAPSPESVPEQEPAPAAEEHTSEFEFRKPDPEPAPAFSKREEREKEKGKDRRQAKEVIPSVLDQTHDVTESAVREGGGESPSIAVGLAVPEQEQEGSAEGGEPTSTSTVEDAGVCRDDAA
ncbi:hypothetical protein C8Q80DRAFT_1354565 [Daedaleopsis nitida]|nr:hypothetical protein C8Q80DRAFT_1354565 [Daedaleopsis nitida]